MERADPPWFLRLMLREMFQPSPAGRQLVEEFIRPIFRDLQAILTELLPAAVPEQRRHLIGFSIVGQCIHHKLGRQFIRILVGDAEAAGYDADVLTDHIYSFSLAALRGVGAAAGGPAGERP
jgi:hypothetical protein